MLAIGNPIQIGCLVRLDIPGVVQFRRQSQEDAPEFDQ